ncbi:MAG TPA: PhoU domain-containing protein [Candidatus Dormibacteraeota bacterium]|nr:PhoU domain-containing protein [Candidatus Dormibacteraeota bacterium]
MNSVELRKLQMTGGASYTVSLPKDWIKEQGLKVGDVVAVMPRADSSLTLIPHEKVPAGQGKGAEVTVSPEREQERDQILRTILAQYLAGYDVIRVRFPATAKPDLRTFLRESARKMFVGSEIIEESKDELIVQCLSSYGDLPAPKVISRMSLIAKLMLRDAVDSLKRRDTAMAEEIARRDEEVDRFYLFLIRQLTMAVLNRSLILEIGLADPRDCLVYRVVSKSLERIGDHATNIAKMSGNVEAALPPRLVDEISKASDLTISVLEDALKSLAKSDGVLANRTIASAQNIEREAESVMDKLFGFKLSQKSIVAVRLALESLKRISEYAEDIAEMAINLTARRTELY